MVIANLALRFALELFGIGALAYWGFDSANSVVPPVVLGLGAALALIVVWSLVVAPKAKNRLPQRHRTLIGTGLLLGTAVALGAAGQPGVALVFAGVRRRQSGDAHPLRRRPAGIAPIGFPRQLKERIDVKIAPSLHRLGSSLVNSYLVEDGGSVTMIDAGLPGYWRDLPTELAAMGRSLDDVRGVVLTHGDTDHVGFAERLRRERGIPVYVHALDADRARGEVKKPSSGWGPMKIGPLLGFLAYSGRRGGLRVPPLTDVVTFDDGATLDLPGAPRVIHLPGAHAGKLRDPCPGSRRGLHGRHHDDEKRPDRRDGTAARTVHAEA